MIDSNLYVIFVLSSWYWTGTSLQWRLVRGYMINKRLMSFAFEKTPALASLASSFQSNTGITNMPY